MILGLGALNCTGAFSIGLVGASSGGEGGIICGLAGCSGLVNTTLVISIGALSEDCYENRLNEWELKNRITPLITTESNNAVQSRAVEWKSIASIQSRTLWSSCDSKVSDAFCS